ncbi:MAG: vanadium-dependent haloperoxidase, partial [Planctomycetota bacterium]
EIGRWQPDPVNPGQEAWGPAWGQLAPFALKSVDKFVPPPMPDVASPAYATSYNEVKELGSIDSTLRTPEQTEIGLFWAYDRVGLGTPLALYNDALRAVAEQEGNTVEENAELFAKASVAMADAAIVAWDAKFAYDFWRPVTGIRDGDIDGNPLTEGDADWTPLGAPDGEDAIGFTPPFPTYISGHATFGGAVFGSLIEFYGTDDIGFTLASEELEILLADAELQELFGLNLEDAERTFSSFSEAMAENGRSRVYLGIHWDYDDLVGQEVGVDVAEALFDRRFVAAKRPGHSQGLNAGRVPEPSAAALLMVGIAACIIWRRQRG